MLNKKRKILEIFANNVWKKFTFREIKKLSKSKSESYIYTSLKQFVRKKILIEEKAGNVILYSANKTQKAAINLAIAAEYAAWNKKHIPYKTLEKIIAKIPTSFFTLIITGSYAKNKQNQSSDIDIIILCDKQTDPQKIYAELRQECELSIPEVHLYVFTEKEFYKMLTNKKPNYGKEIANNSLILSGGTSYYKIMAEAIANGFNG
ncbi:nucleotidyltransferase domain-containing protein [Candidatus Woesearchaeota archaeon]|nr:nucleotidyltransferase domain-containing protein [Candidatus Woesearchaeota archaeon]